MAQGNSAETVGVYDGSVQPAAKTDARVVGGRMRRYRAVLDLSLAAVKHTSGDTNVLFRLPADSCFAYGIINASATMGATATIAIGNATTAGKYRAAAIFTAAAPTMFGLSTAEDDPPLSAEEEVIMTIAAADLPSSGVLIIEIFASSR